ncbi:hypothetical protein JW988_05350 [Candidatus Bathyarchaeota archaeon]|nr:hypothetical protein [Candidatus Bathyarchaeota archaeon]
MENFIRLCKKLHSSEKSYEWTNALSALSNINTRTKIIASVAIFSALYGVIRLIPLGPMIGLSASFSVSDSLAPLYGIILGPFTGGISIIIGTFLAMALGKAPVFLGLDFLPAFVNAVVLGFLVKRKWKAAVLLNLVLIIIFLLSPYSLLLAEIPIGSGTLSFPFIWLHIVAFIILISPLRSKAISWIESLKTSSLPWGLAIVAFIGTMMQHITGNLVFELTWGVPIGGLTAEGFQGIWTVAFFAYPIERAVLVLITVLVGVPLVRILKRSLFIDSKTVSAEQS